MMMSVLPQEEAGFLMVHIPQLLERFSLSYEKNDKTCIEYFLFSKEKFKEISRSLIVSHEIFPKSLYIAKFYPEIYKELNCKYLSAACFYVMVQHAIQEFHLSDNCSVNLEAEDIVFNSFYSRLKDFDFKIQFNRPANRHYVRGRYHEIPFKADRIKKH